MIGDKVTRKKPEPDEKPEPVYLAKPFPAPPKGCRYYLAKKRKLCGKPVARDRRTGKRKNYCSSCAERVTPLIQTRIDIT